MSKNLFENMITIRENDDQFNRVFHLLDQLTFLLDCECDPEHIRNLINTGASLCEEISPIAE